MLKSRFKLQTVEDDEDKAPPPPQPEPEPEEKAEPEPLAEAEEQVQEEGSDLEIPASATENGRVLQRSQISQNLSMLGKTADGDGYTYLKATLTEMKLMDIKAITFFKHLQFLNVSRNLLTTDALQVIAELPSLILIHADVNLLTSPVLKKMKYLQVIIMNHNRISSVKNVFHPYLSTLEVGHNKIKDVQFDHKLPHIKVLDFRYNLIQDIRKLNFVTLDSLFLAANKIKSLAGLENMPNLRIVHARDNPIKDLEGFCLAHTKLIYLNLRNTKIKSLRQLKKLKDLENLDTLIIQGTPFTKKYGEGDKEADDGDGDDEEMRIDLLAMLQRLKKINKEAVTPEERVSSKKMLLQWITEGRDFDDEMGEEEEEKGDQ